MTSDTLHIAFCVSDQYANYACVTIQSIIDNNQIPIHIHILSDYLSPKTEKNIHSIINKGSKNASLTIHTIDDSSLKGLPGGLWGKYTWFRIFMPTILTDVDRILYLDGDTLVVGDLSPLLDINIEGKSIGGILEDGYIRHKKRLGMGDNVPYFCAGVTLWNLKYFRENDITKKIINWATEHKDLLEMIDQDCLNYICEESSFLLPFKYGVTPALYDNKAILETHKSELKKAFESPVIIHYAGWRQQPWFNSCTHYEKDLWWKYQKRANVKIKKIYEEKGFKSLKIRLWVWWNNPAKKRHQLFDQRLK